MASQHAARTQTSVTTWLGRKKHFLSDEKEILVSTDRIWTWRGHERSSVLPGLMLAMNIDNHIYFPPNVFYFVLGQDPHSAPGAV